jgi:hypothetical protein
MHYNLILCLGLMSHTGTVKQALLNNLVRSYLKPACAVFVKM